MRNDGSGISGLQVYNNTIISDLENAALPGRGGDAALPLSRQQYRKRTRYPNLVLPRAGTLTVNAKVPASFLS